MARIEFLNSRIAGKQKEIAKLEAKMARILKAKASGWEDNPYFYMPDDEKWTARDIEKAKNSLAEYEEKLAAETEKANSRNVEAILEYLAAWQKNVLAWYSKKFPEYIAERKAFNEANEEYDNWYWNERGRMDKSEAALERKKAHNAEKRAFEQRWNFIYPYIIHAYGTKVLDVPKLERDLKVDADAKYDDIIERTNGLIGTIKDASGLSIGAKGELNGFIKGQRGTVKVETIGAGGYNIQCFHFRTLIHKVA